MSEPREPVTAALWANLWDDLRRHATGRISGREIIDRHRAAIEAEAARAAVEARDRELRAAVETERREAPWPQFGVPSGHEATACDAYNAALDAVLHLLSPAAD